MTLLKWRLLEKKMTQRQLGDMVGKKDHWASEVILGRLIPNPFDRKAIANALDCSPDDLWKKFPTETLQAVKVDVL